MADISASDVMKLRKISGQGMMDCKKALAESDGDMDQAMDLLRKKGLATMSKRAGRETSEGLVVTKAAADGKIVVLASLCSETDFVAKSDGFAEIAELLTNYAIVSKADAGVDGILETVVDGKSFTDVITELVSQTGEKTQVGNYVRYKLDGPGLIAVYVHFNKKIGAMVKIEADTDAVAASSELATVASDVAMHITATNPLALDKDDIDAEVVAKEKALFVEQVKGKPENIIDKIVDGKLAKFYGENCLKNQKFVKDDSKTVEQVITDAGKAAGGNAKLVEFVRISVED